MSRSLVGVSGSFLYNARMLEMKGLSKKIGGKTIVDGITHTITKGSVFGFLGQNGAGKTTTMKMLVGLNRPTHGLVRIDGQDPTIHTTREQIGYMPEEAYYYEHLTGIECLRFSAGLFKQGASEASCVSILEMVGIAEAKDQKITTYSKGMKQRLGFAQALVNDPEYVFLDEPLDGLDPIGRRTLKRIVGGLKEQGKTVVFNSHILFDVEELCDEIGVLHRGALVYAGAVQSFTKGRSLEERFVTTIEDIEQRL